MSTGIFRKVFAVVLSFVIVLGSVPAISAKEAYSYSKVQEVFDWGTGVTKVIVHLDTDLDAGDVDWTTFEVFVKRFDKTLNDPFLDEGYRRVKDAYVSDEQGQKLEKGSYVTIEMEVAPDMSICSALNYVPRGGGNRWVDAEYAITQVKDIVSEKETISGIVATQLDKTFMPQIDKFTLGSESYNDEFDGNITLTYAAYEPDVKYFNKSPLVIWLHGGGEGGTDATIPLAANKSVNFASDEIQRIFGGAYVLVPQTPTRWMEVSSREEELNVNKGSSNRPYTSKYTRALMHLIEEYVEANPDIDKDRIYIGGCSNGGFMTIRMMLSYPGYFAAGYPVCEGMLYTFLTDDDIEKLVDQNIWFVTAATDFTLPAPDYTLPLYDRLIKEGAQNVHLSYFERVIDTSGQYRDENGNPYEYNGHWSWIYVYNNEATAEINDKVVSIIDWMAAQRKN